MASMKRTTKQRFWSHVDKSKDCWEWIGHTSKTLYPSFYLGSDVFDGSRYTGGNRASWLLNVGPIPYGMYVCHRCDNRACVRPSHLFLGTLRENMLDRHAKGRSANGDSSGRRSKPMSYPYASHRKLTDAQISEIFSRKNSGESNAILMKEFGVSKSAINRIASGLTWGHITRAYGMLPR